MTRTIDRQATQATRARYNRIAPIYDLVEHGSEGRFKPWRERLWAGITAGRVLEVGVGTGKNFAHHPSGAAMTGVDFADRMLARARALAFPDNTFDAAAATFVFCSVPDPVRGTQEMARVVKPGGRILLLEHVRVDRPVIGTLMDWLNAVVTRLWGANINRRTVENVRLAGLQIDGVESLGPMGMVKLIRARARA